MYKHCTTEESVLRQRQLESCLLDLMLVIPYSQITISHICQQAGISRKSFYRYFGSKEGCLCALLDHSIMEGGSHYLPEHGEAVNVHILYERFFGYWKQMKPLMDALARNNLTISLVERMMVYLEEEEAALQNYLGGRANDSYEQLLFFVSGIMGLVISWHGSGYQKSISQMASIMEKVIQN